MRWWVWVLGAIGAVLTIALTAAVTVALTRDAPTTRVVVVTPTTTSTTSIAATTTSTTAAPVPVAPPSTVAAPTATTFPLPDPYTAPINFVYPPGLGYDGSTHTRQWFCVYPPDPDGIDRSGSAGCSGQGLENYGQ